MRKRAKAAFVALCITIFTWTGSPGASVAAVDIPIGGVAAQQDPVTEPSYIASLFLKISGKQPDFNIWAQETPAYKKAAPEEKLIMLETKAAELESVYNLITLVDPIIVTMNVRLSDYNKTYKGFSIDSFTPNLFFSFKWLDQNYAVVPNAIADRQWLPVPKEYADNFPYHFRGGEGQIQIKLLPNYADTKAPMMLEGKDHWLILADVSEISLWSWDGRQLLWRSRGKADDQARDKKILDLYR